MTNFDASERFDQAYCAKIDTLVWIAGSLMTTELRDLVQEMEEDDLYKCFPDIFKSTNADRFWKDHERFLIDYEKFGVLARVLFPMYDNYSYDEKGEVKSASIHEGSCMIAFIYAESLEELLDKIEIEADKKQEFYIAKDKKKKAVV